MEESLDKRVLVIGGAGYIGSVLIRRLLERGYIVRVLDNLLYDNGSSIRSLIKKPSFSFAKGDFCDRSQLEKSLEGMIDIVLLAALVGEPICSKYPELAKQINQDGSMILFDSLDGRKIRKFIFASTCSNYGIKDEHEITTEDSELSPQSLYAETKVAVEEHILRNKDLVPFNPTILRFATAYGVSERMRFDLTVSHFTRDLALGRKLVVYSADAWRAYCHVRDISEAIIRVLELPKETVRGQVFNVGGENITKRMVVDKALQIVGNRDVVYQDGGSDPRSYRVSFDKIRALGFKSQHSVEVSMQNLVTSLRNGLFRNVDANRNFYGNYEIRQ